LSDGSAVGLRIPGSRQRPGEFSIPQKSTRHASQGRPAGMERGAKNGFAVHRAGLPMNTVIGVARDDLG